MEYIQVIVLGMRFMIINLAIILQELVYIKLITAMFTIIICQVVQNMGYI